MTKKKNAGTRPGIFVASSAEGLDVAYAIQDNLTHDAEVTVWPQSVFELSKSTMQSLTEQIARSDFGVFVFTPDDVTNLRGKQALTVRDNVILELGLFAGRLTIERTFIVTPTDDKNLHIPTDLLGLTSGKYNATRTDANLAAALGPFCNQVRRVIERLGPINAARKRPRARQATSAPKLRNVIIHSAMYGAGPHRVDVKKAIMKELRARGAAFVGNQLGGDPTPNVVKDLQLGFSFRGNRKQVVVPEKSSLVFPE